MRLLCGLLLACSAMVELAAAEPDVLIIIKKRKQVEPSSTVVAMPRQQPPERHRDDIYNAIWSHPDQTFVDSDLGPLPLYFEVTFDAAGNPVPRFPDYFTKRYMDDPTGENARLYLEANAARWRRLREATTMLRRASYEYGYITPESFEPSRQAPVDQHTSIYNPENIAPSSRGAPIMDEELAIRRGLDPDTIPLTPNPYAAKEVELLLMWDWRQENIHETMREWSAFAKDLRERKLGVRVVNISMDNHQERVRSYLKYFEYMDIGFDSTENFLDVTNLRQGFSVRVLPTYVFIDRRSGNVLRLEGHQDIDELRRSLLKLVDREAGDEWAPRASWFSKRDPAAVDSEEQRGLFPETFDPENIPLNAVPVMPRTAPAPWIPE
jgi:hypothetical protein